VQLVIIGTCSLVIVAFPLLWMIAAALFFLSAPIELGHPARRAT
jgi:hypothetical protein